jgi:hypothetical protein
VGRSSLAVVKPLWSPPEQPRFSDNKHRRLTVGRAGGELGSGRGVISARARKAPSLRGVGVAVELFKGARGLAVGRRRQQIGETWRDIQDFRDIDATVIPASQAPRDAAPRPVFPRRRIEREIADRRQPVRLVHATQPNRP